MIDVGRHTYGQSNITIHWPDDNAKLSIGSFCSIAERCEVFLGGNHRADWVTTYPFPRFETTWPTAHGILGHPATRGDVSIGNDVWIGANVTIMSGVKIGDGAVLAARSTIVRDVEPYAVVGGGPAELIRFRFTLKEIEALLAIRWWEWPDDKISAEIPGLCSGDVQQFIAAHAKPNSGSSKQQGLLS